MVAVASPRPQLTHERVALLAEAVGLAIAPELPRRCSAVGTRGDLAVERHCSEAPPTLVLGTAPEEEVWDRAGTLRAVAAQSGVGVRFAGGAPQGWEVGDIGGASTWRRAFASARWWHPSASPASTGVRTATGGSSIGAARF